MYEESDATTIEEIEQAVAETAEAIALEDKLERLLKNDDFRDLIVEGYFKQEPIRLVFAMSDRALQRPEVQDELKREMIGIGQLENYFIKLRQIASQGKQRKADGLQAIEEMQAEID